MAEIVPLAIILLMALAVSLILGIGVGWIVTSHREAPDWRKAGPNAEALRAEFARSDAGHADDPSDHAAEDAPDSSPLPDGEDPDGLVLVHIAGESVRAQLLMGLLDSHGIPSHSTGHVAAGVYAFSVTPLAEVRIYVRARDVVRARALLAEWG